MKTSAKRFAGVRTQEVLEEVWVERYNQHEKWGEQNHSDFDRVLVARKPFDAGRLCEEYEVPCEERAKWLCEENFRRGSGTYAHILVEELSEAIACGPDKAALRKELIQLAAVAVAWIEKLDREAGGGR